MSPRLGAPYRRTSQQARRLSLRVFTEGIKTEPIYLTHWHRLYRDRVIVSIANDHGSPITLVKAAAPQRTHDLREARRGRGDAFDQYWCVFDVDAHPHLNEALLLAHQEAIEIAYSNPCIELWFLLHFQDQTAQIDRHTVQRLSRDLLGCEKVLTPNALQILEGSHGEATARARALDLKHDGDDSPRGSNPSSSLWRLIEVIRNA